MRITPYQQNANIMREAQRVIHEKNLKQLERLNHQNCEMKKKIPPANVWAQSGRVDVMV